MLIQVFRDKPELLKTSFGMKAHKLAVSKIKGTEWERVLFESNKPTAEVKRFREAIERQEHGQALKTEDELRMRKDKSVTYIADVKRARAKRFDNGGGVA